MRILKLYARFIPIYFKSKTEYHFGFYADFVGFALYHAVNYLTIWVLLSKFQSINGWNFYQVAFLYTLNMFTHGVAALFLSFQMQELGQMVRMGTFDGLLCRPVNVFAHVVIRTFGHFYLGDIAIGIVMFILCMKGMRLSLSPVSALFFVITLLGGILIQASLFIFTGAMNFWFVDASSIRQILVYNIRGFIDYPVSVYGKMIQGILTFALPFAFINFYPAQLILGKTDASAFSPALQYLTLPVGILLVLLSYGFWHVGVNRYQGTGS